MEWNEERIATLTKLWREGYSASQVAARLTDISRSAVIGKVHRLGLAGRDAPSRPRAAGGRPPKRTSATPGGVLRITTPRPPRPAAPPAAAFVAAPTATIFTLTEHGCRWPIGEPEDSDFGFCGRLSPKGAVYCNGHAPMATRSRAPMKGKEIDRLVSRFVEGGGYRQASQSAVLERHLMP